MTAYVTLDELKDALGVEHANEDSRFAAALNAASRAVDDFCGRVFTTDTAATARQFQPHSGSLCLVDDFYTTSGLVVKTDDDDDGTFETTWAAADYLLQPLNGRRGAQTWPYTEIHTLIPRSFPRTAHPAVEVTAKWGWTTPPEPVKYATRLLAMAAWKRKDAPFGVAGFDTFGVVRVRDDPDVARALGPYRLGRVG